MKSKQKPPIGSLEWGLRNHGALTFTERKYLLILTVRTALEFINNLTLYKLGFKFNNTRKLDLENLKFPDSGLVKKAEEECLNTLSDEVISHSLRTFVFGWALSQVEEPYKNIDIEHLYITSLLHDIAIESQNSQTCFAVAGARKTSLVVRSTDEAENSDEIKKVAQDLGDAVSMHITPGINRNSPGSLAALISDASFLDISGYKIWNLNKDFVREVDQRNWILKLRNNISNNYPTTKQSRLYIADCWKQRAQLFPQGRVALVENTPPGFSNLIRYTPLR